MGRRLAEKYFNNLTNQVESQRVLEWFSTNEGLKYLHERLQEDRHLMNRDDLSSNDVGLDSEKLYKSIQSEINGSKRNFFFVKNTDWLGYAVKAAATVLVILTATFFTLTDEWNSGDEPVEREPIIYQTAEDQHREITLADGSVVRLNKNSEITISEDYMLGSREITLTGEAYFDVTHNPDKPFIIHTAQSSIEVLGTAFNVRSVSGQENVQVAVVEGRVSFSAAEGDYPYRPSVILSRGQYGYLDLNERSILVDEMAIDNYLAWKSGRFVFKELTLQQVCLQLKRISGIQCSFDDPEIKNLTLTADFSNESIEKALSVIALSLRIEFKKDEENVTWFKKKS